MSILFHEQIKIQLIDEVSATTDTLQIISAYCKESAISFIEEKIVNTLSSKRLLVRFSFDDIISGASDLSIYEFCKKNNWKLYLRFDLHAKTYIFDNKRCIVGSANLTSRGIGLASNPNYEISTLSEVCEEEMLKINSLFEGSILMTDELYDKMKLEVSNYLTEKMPIRNWSNEILSLIANDINVLFTYDLPSTSFYIRNTDFLGIDSYEDIDYISNVFKSSKAYRWLVKTVYDTETGEMYFGALTEKLHQVLINDPKPYRKEVKDLLANLLDWIEKLNLIEVTIDRPNYSQRVSIKK